MGAELLPNHSENGPCGGERGASPLASAIGTTVKGRSFDKKTSHRAAIVTIVNKGPHFREADRRAGLFYIPTDLVVEKERHGFDDWHGGS